MPDHVYELNTFAHNNAGNFFQNTFKFRLSESGVGVSPFNYADALISKWMTQIEVDYLALFGNDVLVDFITAKKINGTKGPSAARIVGDAGSSAGISCSSGAAADIQWQTASPLNRPGHTYIAAFPFDSLKGDVFQTPYFTKVSTFIGTLQTTITLAGALGTAEFGIYTRKTDAFFLADSGQLRPKATMMNRRLLPQV